MYVRNNCWNCFLVSLAELAWLASLIVKKVEYWTAVPKIVWPYFGNSYFIFIMAIKYFMVIDLKIPRKWLSDHLFTPKIIIEWEEERDQSASFTPADLDWNDLSYYLYYLVVKVFIGGHLVCFSSPTGSSGGPQSRPPSSSPMCHLTT